MLLGDRITGRYDLARFQRGSQILSRTRMNGRSFSFPTIAAHTPRGTTEFRVGPAPELRRVITQLHRFFLSRRAKHRQGGYRAEATVVAEVG